MKQKRKLQTKTKFRGFRLFQRITAAFCLKLFVFVFIIAPLPVRAQPYTDFESHSRGKVQNFVDRAAKLDDETAWSNYVLLGLASKKADWEDDAYELLKDEFKKIEDTDDSDSEKNRKRDEARIHLNEALLDWELDAQNYFLVERGTFKADLEALTITGGEITDAQYKQILAELEAKAATDAGFDLNNWDDEMFILKQPFTVVINTELDTKFQDIRNSKSGLSGEEKVAFEKRLDEIREEISTEFRTRDEYYTVSARNRFYYEREVDKGSLSKESQEKSAAAVGDRVLNDTLSELETEANQILSSAVQEMQELASGPAGSIDQSLWESRMEALINAGLRKWELAEEDLFQKRLLWQRETDTTREKTNQVWEKNHDKLKAAMNDWLEDIQKQILDGRALWQTKIVEMQKSREQAERELADYVQNRKEQWQTSSAQLTNMVQGGGASLLEAKDAYRYYSDMLVKSGYVANEADLPNVNASVCGALVGTSKDGQGGQTQFDTNDSVMCNFYIEERAKLGLAISNFNTILDSTENVLKDRMQSSGDDSGFLKDVRAYAGDLHAVIFKLPALDFRAKLEKEMQDRGEDFLLYRQDIEHLINSNEHFVGTALELKNDAVYDYKTATTLEELLSLTNKLDQKYFEHRDAVLEIINKDRGNLTADAELTQIKTDIEAWLKPYVDVAAGTRDLDEYKNERLRTQVLSYFSDGAAGYYLTASENDPYLMTQAEYEWEMLRRRRNYYGRRLRRTEAVKRYADMAAQHDAALELASVTEERTKVAEIKAALLELEYLIRKGEVQLDPEVFNGDWSLASAAIQTELTRLLTERGIDMAFLESREKQLITEALTLSDLSKETGPDAAQIQTYISKIEGYLDLQVQGKDAAETAVLQEKHYLGGLRKRLLAHLAELKAGGDASVLANRWTALQAFTGDLLGEIQGLQSDYNITGIKSIMDGLKGKDAANRGVMGDPDVHLKTISTSMDVLKEKMKANAIKLAEAKTALEDARNQYRNAFIDLQILNSSNSAELIRIELSNATDGLSSVLHRMQKIEDIPGFTEVQDSVTAGSLKYLYEVSQTRAASQDYEQSKDLIERVEALEAAKKRLVAAEQVQLDNNFTGKDIGQIADYYLAKEAELVNVDAQNVYLRSGTYNNSAFSTLKRVRQDLKAARANLTKLQNKPAGEDPATEEELELQKALISRSEEEVYRSLERFMGYMRGEPEFLRDMLFTAMGEKDAAGKPRVDVQAELKALETHNKELEKSAYVLSESIAQRLKTFMEAQRGESLADIMKALNAEIAATDSGRGLDLARDYDQVGPAGSPGERAILLVVRDFITAYKEDIKTANAAADSVDAREKDERWDDLLKALAKIEAETGYHDTFTAKIPVSKDDTWVVNFKNERGGLLNRLTAVLGGNDAGLYNAFRAMSAGDRELLARYGTPDILNMRASLKLIQDALATDVAGVDFNFRAIYLREASIGFSETIRGLEERRRELSLNLGTRKWELTGLRKDLAESPPAGQAAEIQARITLLEGEVSVLETELAPLDEEYNSALSALKEISDPGSGNLLYGGARAQFNHYAAGIEYRIYGLQNLAGLEREQSQAQGTGETQGQKLVKAIIGFYETDSEGKLKETAAGEPIPTQEYLDLLQRKGLPLLNADIYTVLGGDLQGDELARWVKRLQEYLADEERSVNAPPEVAAAVELLEPVLRDYMAAIELIQKGSNRSMADIKTEAVNRLEQAGKVSDKLNAIILMETGLDRVVQNTLATIRDLQGKKQQALSAGQSFDDSLFPDVAVEALAFLEKPENVKLLFLFEGYGIEGDYDGVIDLGLQARVNEIRNLARKLRSNAYAAELARGRKLYAEFQRSNLDVTLPNGVDIALWPNITGFLENYTIIQDEGLVDAVLALPDAGYRAALFTWLEQDAPDDKPLYLNAIHSVLMEKNEDGPALKALIKTALETLRTNLRTDLETFGGDMDRYTDRIRDLQSDENVAQLMDDYANRGADARTLFQPELNTLDQSLSAEDTKAALEALADTHFKDGVFKSIRSGIYHTLDNLYSSYETKVDAINAASAGGATQSVTDAELEAARVEFLTLAKTELEAYLNALVAPDATTLADLTAELEEERIQQAVLGSSISGTYEEDHYPEEMREFVLVYQYQQAEKRYADYLQARNTDAETEKEKAVLNLSGLNGDYARHILVRDFEDYIAANKPVDFLTQAGGKRSVGDYLSAYLTERNTDGNLLPDGGAEILKRAHQAEYKRIQTLAVAAGGLHLVDENQVFSDFREYILLARGLEYVNRKGLVLSGADEAEKRLNFETAFAGFFTDPALKIAGQTQGERFPGQTKRDLLTDLLFSNIYFAVAPELHLPGELAQLSVDGKLNDPLQDVLEYLPEELRNITGYQSADYKTIAGGISNTALKTLAKMELNGRLSLENLSLSMSDSELEAIINRSGHTTLPADIQNELVDYLRLLNEQVQTGGATSVDGARLTTRLTNVLEAKFPNPAERHKMELFLGARSTVYPEIESKFFAALAGRDARLQDAAKLDRGGFLEALILRSANKSSALYTNLGEMQAEFDQLQAELFNTGGFNLLKPEQIADLQQNQDSYKKLFDLRSAQELVQSGVLESVEFTLFGGLERSTTEVLLTEAKANKNAVLKDYINLIYYAAQNENLSGFQTQSGVSGIKAELIKVLEQSDPYFKRMIYREKVMVDSLLNDYLESDQERNRMVELLRDPALLNSSLRKLPDYETDQELLLLAEENTALQASLLGMVTDHRRLFKEKYLENGREAHLAQKLKEFSFQRGAGAANDYQESKYSNYRTYLGAERLEQVKQYRDYLSGLISTATADGETSRANAISAYKTAVEQNNSPETWDDTVLAGMPGEKVKSYFQYFSGKVLGAQYLGLDDPANLFQTDKWQEQLTSDQTGSLYKSTTIDRGVGQDPLTIEMYKVKTVFSEGKIDALDPNYAEKMRRIFYANLANNYLEAVSNLNRSLLNVFRGAQLAESRKETTRTAVITDLKSNYDIESKSSLDTTALTTVLNTKATTKDSHTIADLNSAYDKISGLEKVRREGADAFAQAGRRKMLDASKMTDLLEKQFKKVSAAFDKAQKDVKTYTDIGIQDRQDYAAANSKYVDALNQMAGTFRKFTEANEQLEQRRAVMEYAQTPYLQVSGADTDETDVNKFGPDAQDEYNLALAAYKQVQELMKEAGLKVRSQGDNLADFNAIIAVLETGTQGEIDDLGIVLSDDERKELTELEAWIRENPVASTAGAVAVTQADIDAKASRAQVLRRRQLYDIYKDMIVERADYFKQSMRMVRLHKANEIVNAEIERRRAAAATAKQNFQEALDQSFSLSAVKASDREAAEVARMKLYKRLSNLVGSGGDLYHEYKAWYWGMGSFVKTGITHLAGLSATEAPSAPQITPTQHTEGVAGLLLANNINQEDQSVIGDYFGLGGGVSEFDNFSNLYYGSVIAMGNNDATQAAALITSQTMLLTIPISTALIAAGGTLIALGTVLQGVAAGLIASIVGIPVAPLPTAASIALVASGVSVIASGVAGIATALATIAAAQAAAVLSNIMQWVSVGYSYQAAQDTQYITWVQEKEKKYQEAQAELDYFTKVPDQEELKRRIIQWGGQHGDPQKENGGPNLYKITEEDLKYLYELDGNGQPVYENFVDDDGVSRSVNQDEINDGLDVTQKKRDVEFVDSFGVHYDPNSIKIVDPTYNAGTVQDPSITRTTEIPAVRGGYFYFAGDGNKYIQIKTVNHNGTHLVAYARVLNDNEPVESKAYDMGEILKLAVTHGDNLRKEAKARYVLAGNGAGDPYFVLNERDNTMQKLYENASDRINGGREFTGYRMTFADYQENAGNVVFSELSQKVTLQKEEWDLRQLELKDKYDAWERKMAAIFLRGQKAWGSALNNYKQNWREWEKKFNQKEAEARAKWQDKIDTHEAEKLKWEQMIRTKYQQTVVKGQLDGVLDNLNAQIQNFNANTGNEMEGLDKAGEISRVMEEIKEQLPTRAEQLDLLNSNIAKFNTRLELSDVSNVDLLGDISGNYGAFEREMEVHKANMRVVSNKKVHEQFENLLEKFKAQLRAQNKSIYNQTRNAALNQGFIDAGGVFIKKGHTGSAIGTVNAYQLYKVDEQVDGALSQVGFNSLNGNALVSFLREKSTVEVESFFHVQTLALQRAMEVVLGRGTSEQRDGSRDENMIGSFGVWAGNAGDSEKAGYMSQAAGGSFGSDMAGRSTLINNVMFGGFGELGAAALRPSGSIIGGFYVQLQWMGQHVSQEEMKASAPNATVAGFAGNDIGYLYAKTVTDARIATEVYGEDAGKAYRKAARVITREAGQAVAGTIATTAMAAGPVGFPIAAAATAVNMALETIQDEGGIKMSSKAGVEMAGMLADLGMSYFGGTKALTGAGMVAAKGVKATLMGGFQYDDKGRIKNYTLEGEHGQRALFSGAMAAGSAAVGQSMGDMKGLSDVGSLITGFGQGHLSSVISDVAMGNYDQKHNPLGFAQQWNQTGLDKLASKISSVTGILAGQAFSPVMGRMKAEYDWNNANEELNVIMDVIEHEKSKRDRNHKNNQALDALYGAAYENMKKRGIAATGEIKDLKRNTNAEKFLNNLAKYYDVSVKQMKKMYLEVNGVGSIGELQTMISEGKPLKVPMGMGWTKNFQSGYYPQAQKVVQTTRPTSNNSGQNAPFVDGLLDPTGFFQQEKEQREAKERAVRNFKKFKDQQSCQADNLAGHKLYDPNFDPNMQQLKWYDYALQAAAIGGDLVEVTAGLATAKFGIGIALVAHGGYNLVKDSMTMYQMIKAGVSNGGRFDNRNRSHSMTGDIFSLLGMDPNKGDLVDAAISGALTFFVGGGAGWLRSGKAASNMARGMKAGSVLSAGGAVTGMGGMAYDGYVNGNEQAQDGTKMAMGMMAGMTAVSFLTGRAMRWNQTTRRINNRSMSQSEWKAYSRQQRVAAKMPGVVGTFRNQFHNLRNRGWEYGNGGTNYPGTGIPIGAPKKVDGQWVGGSETLKNWHKNNKELNSALEIVYHNIEGEGSGFRGGRYPELKLDTYKITMKRLIDEHIHNWTDANSKKGVYRNFGGEKQYDAATKNKGNLLPDELGEHSDLYNEMYVFSKRYGSNKLKNQFGNDATTVYHQLEMRAYLEHMDELPEFVRNDMRMLQPENLEKFQLYMNKTYKIKSGNVMKEINIGLPKKWENLHSNKNVLENGRLFR